MNAIDLALGSLICLYLLVAAYCTAINTEKDMSVGEVLGVVWEAAAWLLVLLPWRDWYSPDSPRGKHCKVAQ